MLSKRMLQKRSQKAASDLNDSNICTSEDSTKPGAGSDARAALEDRDGDFELAPVVRLFQRKCR